MIVDKDSTTDNIGEKKKNSKGEARSLELLLDYQIQLLAHLLAHVVGPVPCHPLPKEGRIRHVKISMINTANLVNPKAAKRPKAA